MSTAATAPDEAERPEQWMVYLPEWLIFYTSRQRGEEGRDECLGWWHEHYRGKIREQDWRIVTPEGQSPANYAGKYRLQLCVPNLKGILRDKNEADDLASQLGLDAVVVARFSAEERRQLRYGKSLIREQ